MSETEHEETAEATSDEETAEAKAENDAAADLGDDPDGDSE